LILLDRDNTRYSGSDAAVEFRSNNLDNIIRAGGGDYTVVAEGGDDWVLDNFGLSQVMGDDGNDTLVAVDGNNAVDQSVSVADVGTTDTLDGGAGNDFLIGATAIY
jgi:Ca2+-binding RTX toxin-like protein